MMPSVRNVSGVLTAVNVFVYIAADDEDAVLHVLQIQIHVERVPLDLAARAVNRDGRNAAFADGVFDVTEEEMHVFVGSMYQSQPMSLASD